MIHHGKTLPNDTLLPVTASGASRSREVAARAWVDAARRAGLDPRIVQQPLLSAAGRMAYRNVQSRSWLAWSSRPGARRSLG